VAAAAAEVTHVQRLTGQPALSVRAEFKKILRRAVLSETPPLIVQLPELIIVPGGLQFLSLTANEHATPQIKQ